MNEILQILKKKITIIKDAVLTMDDDALKIMISHDNIDGFFSKIAKCELARRAGVIEEWDAELKDTGFIISFKSEMGQDEARKVIFG